MNQNHQPPDTQTAATDGWRDVSDRTLIGMTGRDRRRLLHGFCTADIEKLPVGESTEAFVLNGKGKTIGYVRVHAQSDRLLLDSDPEQYATIVEHLDRYVIREDVQFVNLGESLKRILVVGAAVELVNDCLHASASVAEQQDESDDALAVWEVDWLFPCSRLVSGPGEQLKMIETTLSGSYPQQLTESAVDLLRIRQGVPAVGNEINDSVLPQELRRDNRSISFTKGCYLGQETVARIDALGHVNRLLVGLVIYGSTNASVGQSLELDGAKVGTLSSIGQADKIGRQLALGFVKRTHAKSGTMLQCGSNTATIVELPIDDEAAGIGAFDD